MALPAVTGPASVGVGSKLAEVATPIVRREHQIAATIAGGGGCGTCTKYLHRQTRQDSSGSASQFLDKSSPAGRLRNKGFLIFGCRHTPCLHFSCRALQHFPRLLSMSDPIVRSLIRTRSRNRGVGPKPSLGWPRLGRLTQRQSRHRRVRGQQASP